MSDESIYESRSDPHTSLFLSSSRETDNTYFHLGRVHPSQPHHRHIAFWRALVSLLASYSREKIYTIHTHYMDFRNE